MHDVFFLGDGSSFSATNWLKFKARHQQAIFVDGDPTAHDSLITCANLSTSSHFFVVGANDEVFDGFGFSYEAPSDTDLIHKWCARNPVNKLEYSWGGLTLLPKHLVLGASSRGTMTYSPDTTRVVPSVVSIAHFNKTEFGAWSLAFCEAARLSNHVIKHGTSCHEAKLLNVWKTVGIMALNGAWVIDGAGEGALFATRNEDIEGITDREWLRDRFNSRFF
jgi:hypothetical protein